MNKNTFKGFWSVFAGFMTVVILSIATDTVLEQTGVFPPIGTGLFIPWMLVLAFAYRSIFTVIGGYVTARLSPGRPKHHVFILGCVGTAAGIAGTVAGWDLSSHWYPIALAVTAFPFTWLGGRLKTGNLPDSVA